ncbi:hypothetical protein L1987_19974 [Smallanthus sonchifolius]|uniref:Uncharacterized protein n=1 Tax=Smallanthus sonchifolius TaxID=185202 RepID=A0ACB9IRB5_9ASTR|nr:hypothetical protein L1987_19974 [Smallanthus sonchifolius]
MFVLIQAISIVLAFISHKHESTAATVVSSPSSSIVVPVNKHTDAPNPFYGARAYFNVSWYSPQNLLIDLDAPFIWHYSYPRQDGCGACPPALTCNEFPCINLRTTYSYQTASCPPPTNRSYEGNFDCELCPVNVINLQPNSFGYFIGVKAIVIRNRSINVPGNTTTKISTLDPYTKLRTDVYNIVVRRFSRVKKRIQPAKLVAPFGLCFNTSVNGTKVGIRVPDIDLVVQDGKKWTISSANSIKQVTEDVARLAFVDGGSTSEHAIVVGTYQFEDNFVLFDLENSSFGFSSSLLRRQTSCSNFNFNNF